jgi:hypothetical protein
MQAEKGQHGHDHHDQADQINDAVHRRLSVSSELFGV